MNKELINAVANQIERFPETYDQSVWSGDEEINGHCGTYACIAGHACHEAVALKLTRPMGNEPYKGGNFNLVQSAINLLDLPPQFCEMMFIPSFNPPNGIVNFLRRIANREDLQKLTIEVLDKLIRDGHDGTHSVFWQGIQFIDNVEVIQKYKKHFISKADHGGMHTCDRVLKKLLISKEIQ